VSIFWILQRVCGKPAPQGGAGECALARRRTGRGFFRVEKGWLAGKWLVVLALASMALLPVKAQGATAAQKTAAAQGAAAAQGTDAARSAARRSNLPPQVVEAERFLAQRGWRRSSANGGTGSRRQFWAGAGSLSRRAAGAARSQLQAHSQAQPLAQSGATWQPLGPTAVLSQSFGLVTGRISSLALDPSDTSGNTLYLGTTGGGVWKSQNAAASASVSFVPLTDDLSAMSDVEDASISIGAVSVQPGGTGVILAGTGDPNDARDSYYGAGILRSADGGTTWSLIPSTPVTSTPVYSFDGEGFAGFAWSTVNADLVVAAVSQAYDATLVNAAWPGVSYEGLYYSTDGGATWSLATITDGSGGDVQGPTDAFVSPDGNAATSVVWNPVRNLFIAAVRYHGYYQSSDGKTFTRLADQPGTNLAASADYCPTNAGGSTGSTGCPIFRGVLAVNPTTGDTFAWTVDANNQDQGIWQDVCAASGGACASTTLTFAQQWGTAALETSTSLGASTIENGDYNLALAAVPSGQETMLLAGANDLWQTNCPYSQGCRWRNTTNSTTCMSAKVGEYQHALAWNASNPLEIFVGNDSGLWRSEDGISENTLAAPEPVCSAIDASHFQNLNGSLGSLADVASISQAGATPYTMMAGLGANGTAGVASTTAATADWPEILGGEGGPVAIDPVTPTNWYVNNAAGVSIYLNTEGSTPGAFSPVLNVTTDPGALTTTGADVVRDGLSMAVEPPYAPAAFLVDPLDSTKLLIGTCRMWRGPASGVGWSVVNAISDILDGITGDDDCMGNALIRSMAALALPDSTALPAGGEVVYVGMYGAANGDATLPGHVLRATYNTATASWSAWTDLTALNAVTNDTHTMNYYGLDISSIFIDPLDTTGETVYVTVAGIPTPLEEVQTVYGSTDGGAHWTALTANLPSAPANSLVVDPASSSTVYVATDAGVYATQTISSCTNAAAGCWAPLGSGLPDAPVAELSAEPSSASVHNLIAATYGRGIWTTPLLGAGGAGTGPATDTLSTTSLSFPNTTVGQISAAQYMTLTNSGGVALTSIAVSVSGAFTVTNPCTANLAANSSCTISVQFAPTATGYQTGTLTIADELRTQTVELSGTGIAAPALAVSPTSLSFSAIVGDASSPQTLTVTNTGGAPLANVGFQVTGQSAASFSTGATTCGTTLSNVSGQNSCTVAVTFTPSAAGGATASLTVSSSTSGVASVTVPLTGTGQTLAGLNVSPSQLVFPLVAPGKTSAIQTVTVTNNGTAAATSLTFTVTSPFSRAIVTNSCGTSLAAGASCSVGVDFAPALDGSFTGTLTIASPSLASSAVVLLSGTGGVPGSVQFQPNPLTFAQTGVGATSSASTVTITNPDPVTSLSGLTVTPVPAAEFKLASSTCGTTLAAGASCTVGLEFAPTSAGTQSGTLTVSDSVLTAGSTLALSGMGFDFALCFGNTIAPCVTSSAKTIANGQTADYYLTIAPLGGSEGSFTLQCSNLPAYSSCAFNPTSPTAYSGASVYETVEIATGLTGTATNSSRPLGWPALPLACGLALVPLSLARRRRALLLVALLVLLAGGVSSCTSSKIIKGSSGGGGSGVTPAGTYSIPVTVPSNGISHQITLTLTVD